MNEEEIIEILKEMQEICRHNTYIKNEERDEWKREYQAIERNFRFISNRKNREYKFTAIIR